MGEGKVAFHGMYRGVLVSFGGCRRGVATIRSFLEDPLMSDDLLINAASVAFSIFSFAVSK